jgi:hypothetical protein
LANKDKKARIYKTINVTEDEKLKNRVFKKPDKVEAVQI